MDLWGGGSQFCAHRHSKPSPISCIPNDLTVMLLGHLPSFPGQEAGGAGRRADLGWGTEANEVRVSNWGPGNSRGGGLLCISLCGGWGQEGAGAKSLSSLASISSRSSAHPALLGGGRVGVRNGSELTPEAYPGDTLTLSPTTHPEGKRELSRKSGESQHQQ